MKKIPFGVLLFVTLSLTPLTSHAIPIAYSLSGYVIDANQKEEAISGGMTIESQLVPTSKENIYFYDITQFSIITDDFTFAGASGAFSVDAQIVSNGQRYVLSPDWLLGGTAVAGDLVIQDYRWGSQEVTFLNADGSGGGDRTFERYRVLPPTIIMSGPSEGDPLPGSPPGSHGNGVIIATIPEPPALLLLLFGLIGFAILLKSFKFVHRVSLDF